MSKQFNNQESSEFYEYVILPLGEKHRIIRCKDNIQWILQIHSGEIDGSKRFRNLSYIRTKNLLIDVCRGIKPDISLSDLDTLDGLPSVCGVMS